LLLKILVLLLSTFIYSTVHAFEGQIVSETYHGFIIEINDEEFEGFYLKSRAKINDLELQIGDRISFKILVDRGLWNRTVKGSPVKEIADVPIKIN